MTHPGPATLTPAQLAGERATVMLRPPAPFGVDEPYRSILLAWCAANRLPADQCTDRVPITVNLDAGEVTYWHALDGDEPAPAGAIAGQRQPGGRNLRDLVPVVIRLVHTPTGVLIGDGTCGHRWADGQFRPCVLDVDPVDGRHRGVHAAQLEAAATVWPNAHPGLFTWAHGLPSVAGDGMTPDRQHVLVLTALDRLAGGRRDSLAGRGAILERHRPHRHRVRLDHDDAGQLVHVYRAGTVPMGTDNATRWLCRPCGDGRHDQLGALWPCPDYRDAAHGVVSGLEAPA